MTSGEVEGPTAVLVHGAGHTAAVWQATRAAMRHPTFAVDLPGRGRRPADITTVTAERAAESVADDVEAHVTGDVVLVGHSVAGTLLPRIAARLGTRVRRLVLVAGITATDGQPPWDLFLADRVDVARTHLAMLRQEHAGRSLEAVDRRIAATIDSLNFSQQAMSWADVSVPCTWVRCLRDPIQDRDLQDRFIALCRADQVVDIDSGHTPALDAPATLAALLDEILSATTPR
jgi:pimeloyl-ACP methyl ester carboxylesterase